MASTQPSQPLAPEFQSNKPDCIFSDSGKAKFLAGCQEMNDELINKKIIDQIINAISREMNRMMQKHLEKMKKLHRELIRSRN